MRKQFKNIPVGSIITPCAKSRASSTFKKTKHLRRFMKTTGCTIKRLKDSEEFYETNMSLYWNIEKMVDNVCAFKFTEWSKY